MYHILLGAGASVSAGVPTAIQMTEKIVEDISQAVDDERLLPNFEKALNFVFGGILFQHGLQGSDPRNFSVNVELLFNWLTMLETRQTIEGAAFVQWHPHLEELDQISDDELQSLATKFLANIFAPIRQDRVSDKKQSLLEYKKELKQEYARQIVPMSRDLVSLVRTSDARTSSVFTELKHYMVKRLAAYTWIKDESKVAYLIPLVNACATAKVAISTLNYDNAIELASRSANVRFDHGLANWNNAGLVEFDETKLALLKLHGSINWQWRLAENRRFPDGKRRTDGIDVKPKQQVEEPALIFGGSNKLTALGPFLALLNKFDAFLIPTQCLYVVGYSFADSHINQILLRWLNRDKANRVRIFNGPRFDVPSSFENLLRQTSLVENRREYAEFAIGEISTELSRK
jgi:hypothetical protein